MRGEAVWTIPRIAAHFGVKDGTVRQWLHRGQLPAPDGRVVRSPWWREETLTPWLEDRERNG